MGRSQRRLAEQPLVWAAVLALPLAFSLARVKAYYATAKEDWRAAGYFIEANFASGDKVDSPLGGGVIFHYTQRADAGWLDTVSIPDLAALQGRRWVVIHPYIGPAGAGLEQWVAAQPSAVEYQIDDSLRIYVLDKSKAETLAAITPPDRAITWAKLAEQYVLIDDGPQAEAAYRRAIELSDAPIFSAAYADYLRQSGRSDEAARYYLDALARNPNLTPALVGIWRIYLERGLLDEAVLALGRAVAAERDNYAANYFLAQAYDRLGRPADAAVYRERAGQIVPELIEPP